MKTKLLFGLLATVMFLGCTKETPTPTPTPTPKPEPEIAPPFTIKATDISSEGVHVTVTPEDVTETYYYGVISKEIYDSANSDEEFIRDDLAYLSEVAMTNNMTLFDLLEMEGALNLGENSYTFTTLKDNLEYYIYAYGLTTGAQVTTELIKLPFTTVKWEPTDKSTFEVTIKEIFASSFSYIVNPSSSTIRYYAGLVSEEYAVENLANDRDLVDAFIAMENATGVDWATSNSVFTGEKALDSGVYGQLKAETEYRLVVFGVSIDGEQTTAPKVTQVTTVAVKSSENQFTIKVKDLTEESLIATITTTNDDVYYSGIEKISRLEGKTQAEIIVTLIANAGTYIDYFLSQGDSEQQLVALDPDTEYFVYAFGYDAGQSTTEMYKTMVSTTPATTSKATFKTKDTRLSNNVIDNITRYVKF